MSVVVARGLTKSYGSVRAVDGVDLSIEPGEVVALLGPNGAGKTTIVEILEGYRQPDGGEARVLGMIPGPTNRELKQRVGIVLQEAGLEDELTVEEILEHATRAYDRTRRRPGLIDLVGLGEKRDDRVKTLSGGQRRRLELALALAGTPELLFLDEPTTGFDPEARRGAWDMIKALSSDGTTIVLTTHYLEEAQMLADRVIVLALGRILAEGPPNTLGRRVSGEATIRFRLAQGAKDSAVLGVSADDRGMVTLTTGDPALDLHRIISRSLEHEIELIGLEVTRPSLEDVYLDLVSSAPSRP
jgi:ABC-2 type transport system ATP-binding protein